MMLATNLYSSTLPEIGRFVRDNCGQYGTVLSVTVHLYPVSTGQDRPFAIVEMSSSEENSRLREEIGDGYFGDGVLVQLWRRSSRCPYSMRTPDCFRRGRCLLGLSCPPEKAVITPR
ncbi:MAG: hypothetical protein ACT4P8_05955 [Betaproteobacteria bacterium]